MHDTPTTLDAVLDTSAELVARALTRYPHAIDLVLATADAWTTAEGTEELEEAAQRHLLAELDGQELHQEAPRAAIQLGADAVRRLYQARLDAPGLVAARIDSWRELAATLRTLVRSNVDTVGHALDPAHPVRLEEELGDTWATTRSLVVLAIALPRGLAEHVRKLRGANRPSSAEAEAIAQEYRELRDELEHQLAMLGRHLDDAAELAASYLVQARADTWHQASAAARADHQLDAHLGHLVRRSLHLLSVIGPGLDRAAITGASCREAWAILEQQVLRDPRRDPRAVLLVATRAAELAAIELHQVARRDAIAQEVARYVVGTSSRPGTSLLQAINLHRADLHALLERSAASLLPSWGMAQLEARHQLAQDAGTLVASAIDLEALELATQRLEDPRALARLVDLVRDARPAVLEPLDEALQSGLEATIEAWAALDAILAEVWTRQAEEARTTWGTTSAAHQAAHG